MRPFDLFSRLTSSWNPPTETLKYLYLLFDPDSEIDILNKHVFNTEAHPVKIFSKMATSQ